MWVWFRVRDSPLLVPQTQPPPPASPFRVASPRAGASRGSGLGRRRSPDPGVTGHRHLALRSRPGLAPTRLARGHTDAVTMTRMDPSGAGASLRQPRAVSNAALPARSGGRRLPGGGPRTHPSERPEGLPAPVPVPRPPASCVMSGGGAARRVGVLPPRARHLGAATSPRGAPFSRLRNKVHGSPLLTGQRPRLKVAVQGGRSAPWPAKAGISKPGDRRARSQEPGRHRRRSWSASSSGTHPEGTDAPPLAGVPHAGSLHPLRTGDQRGTRHDGSSRSSGTVPAPPVVPPGTHPSSRAETSDHGTKYLSVHTHLTADIRPHSDAPLLPG